VKIEVHWSGLPYNTIAKRVLLDATTGSSIENDRLRPQPAMRMPAGSGRVLAALEPYGIEFWYLEKTRG
jgi:hypothetical protein